MSDKKEIWDEILTSVKSMTVDEYNELYNNITDEENAKVVIDDFEISINQGSISYSIDLQALKREYSTKRPIQIDMGYEIIHQVYGYAKKVA